MCKEKGTQEKESDPQGREEVLPGGQKRFDKITRKRKASPTSPVERLRKQMRLL